MYHKKNTRSCAQRLALTACTRSSSLFLCISQVALLQIFSTLLISADTFLSLVAKIVCSICSVELSHYYGAHWAPMWLLEVFRVCLTVWCACTSVSPRCIPVFHSQLVASTLSKNRTSVPLGRCISIVFVAPHRPLASATLFFTRCYSWTRKLLKNYLLFVLRWHVALSEPARIEVCNDEVDKLSPSPCVSFP